MTTPTSHGKLKTFFETFPSVEFVRWTFVDYGNVSRCILTTVNQALKLAQKPGDTSAITVAPDIITAFWNTGQVDETVFYNRNDQLVPDWDTLKPTTNPEQAMMMCSIKQTSKTEDEWWERDPRIVLKRIEDKARKEFGLEFQVGVEIEFRLIDSPTTLDLTPVPQAGYGLSLIRDPMFAVCTEAVKQMEKAGVHVWAFAGDEPGVFEIALGPSSPLKAVDNVVYAYDAIKSMAIKHGVHATMHPKLFENGTGTGQHIHMSLDKEEMADSFLAGLLAHLPGISPFLLAGVDSYSDTRSFYSGGDDVFWSQTKIVPIRRIGTSRFEFRQPDGLGNTYLQVASLLGVGLDGIRKQLKLEIKECKHEKPGPLDDETRKALGITEKLPTTLGAAIVAMENDEVVLKEALGELCYERYLLHRKEEITKTMGTTREERVKAIVMNI